ncbi:hypothetical protein AB0G06_19570 [Nonomuraea dietziae]|uniref:hypothetical protein n=1 Tax=Nonomuraea dietziae TaxID=65515 RepID=UPI003405B46D
MIKTMQPKAPIEATQEEQFPGDVHWYDLPDDDVEPEEDGTLQRGPLQVVTGLRLLARRAT